MRWEAEFGDKLDLLLKIAEREGRKPPALASRPKQSVHALPYLTAFKDLHASRIIGPIGAGPIPVSEIEAYARLFGFDSLEERQALFHFIRICDQVWLEVTNKRVPTSATGKHTTGRGRQPGHGNRRPAR